MKSHQPSDDQARVRAEGLRRVAVASVAALALVLPLAVAAAHRDSHQGRAGHSAEYRQLGRTASGTSAD